MPKLNRQFLIALYLLLFIIAYLLSRPTDIYTVTAYCNCPICINKHEFQDKRFASYRPTYFGGIAAPREFRFGTQIRLIPLKEKDREAMDKYLEGREYYLVEDRGFLIRGNRLDIFIPQRLGGHKTAQKWGSRKMRIVVSRP